MKKKFTLKNIAILLIVSIFVFSFIRQEITMHKISTQVSERQLELNKVKAVNDRLKDEVNMSKTDAYSEKMAREKLGMIKPGEKKVLTSNDSSSTK
ncbi:septum formation initiator family protein [Clostridium sp. YIM B02505]|uniref:Septum formation initiator family protein n=1 Tax=Clostridium yunnanense TaxID=2800325 RepID=A0ABS1EJS9_9CLOT|nr:septum formation initiator family protein [Clostridium yunnanense]MBK1809593.1 septum formation initiator family protein [Clostridium yunnanense]